MLSRQDLDLVAAARGAIRDRYRPDRHVVGAALRTKRGLVFTGVHLEATVGRIAVYAEAIALGRAATEAGDTAIDVIVAVYHPGSRSDDAGIRVVAPCGMCREMISDYAPDARVIVPRDGGTEHSVPVRDLLPRKFARPPA